MSSDRGDPRSATRGATDGSDRADVPDGEGTPEEDEANGADGGAAADEDGVGGDEEADGESDEAVDGEASAEADRPDETVPAVELGLYQLSVKVNGQSSDSIDDVEASARRLMDYLVDTAEALEDNPDDRGLG
jgi:hypothetical protein